MATSYNGWAGIASAASPQLTTITVPGTSLKAKVRAGAVATVLQYVAARFHAEVESIDITPGMDDWGYANRKVRDGKSLSNHASGTAIDLNATRHPWQTSAEQNFSRAQIAAIERIVADCDGVVRWLRGHDPMHFEIQRQDRGGDPTRVGRLAERIAGGAASARSRPLVPPRVPLRVVSGSPPTPLTRIVQEAVGVRPDGVRGPKTMDATRACQERLGVAADGYFGPATARAWLLTFPRMAEGCEGTHVKLLQWIGAEVTDGRWGRRTDDAVESMQQWAGLVVDGVAGPKTIAAIVR